MTNEELKARIEQKEKAIEKIQNRITKWENSKNEQGFIKRDAPWYTLTPKAIKNLEDLAQARYNVFKDRGETLEQSRERIQSDYEGYIGNCEGEIRRAKYDLEEAQKTLEKYHTQLDAKANFDNMTKIKVIWDFLQDWRKAVYEFVLQNAALYAKLKATKQEGWDNYVKSKQIPEEDLKSWRTKYWWERKFEEEWYEDIASLTKLVYKYNGKVDEEKLNKYLDKEVEAKYKNLVARITEKAGEIQDASGLYIANNGEINGYVQGSKNKVKVETITAGGYNIQIRHYRVLVHVVK